MLAHVGHLAAHHGDGVLGDFGEGDSQELVLEVVLVDVREDDRGEDTNRLVAGLAGVEDGFTKSVLVMRVSRGAGNFDFGAVDVREEAIDLVDLDVDADVLFSGHISGRISAGTKTGKRELAWGLPEISRPYTSLEVALR